LKVIFVTGNEGKFREAESELAEAGIELEQRKLPVPEIQADTLEEVVHHSVEWTRRQIDGPFFLEDAGFFVDALKGFPGVYSAYAHKTVGLKGMVKLMEGKEDRAAGFQAVIGYWDGSQLHIFKGQCRGRMTDSLIGEGGFGYDPLFIPDGHEKTFAQMDPEEKNTISHRGMALHKMLEHLKG